MFADIGCDVLGAPLPSNHISGYQKLCKERALPILMDEGIYSPCELEEFIRPGMLDGVAMKHSRTAGLLPATRCIELLRENGLFFLTSGPTDPDISLAEALAISTAFGRDKPAALNGPQFLADTVVRGGLPISGDRAGVPRGCGLEIEVDEAKLCALKFDVSFWNHEHDGMRTGIVMAARVG